jgi:hypothetical protein
MVAEDMAEAAVDTPVVAEAHIAAVDFPVAAGFVEAAWAAASAEAAWAAASAEAA